MINSGRKNIAPCSGILIAALLFTASLTLNAQKERSGREEPPPLTERIFFGGSFALQIGSFTDIEIAPVAGLWILTGFISLWEPKRISLVFVHILSWCC